MPNKVQKIFYNFSDLVVVLSKYLFQKPKS